MISRFARLFGQAANREIQALASQNARLYEETRRRLAESESLRKVTTALLHQPELGGVLEIVCIEAQQLTGAQGSAVLLLDADRQRLRAVRHSGLGWPDIDKLPVEGSFAGVVVRDGRARLTNDPGKEQQYYPAATDLSALLVAPLLVNGVSIGVLDVLNKPGGFTEDDLRTIGLFADQAAIAIENARLRGQAEQFAVLEERQRLARELHDSVTQSVYGVTLLAEAVAGLLAAGDQERAVNRLGRLQETAQDALKEMRLLVFELRPPVLDKEGLVAALQNRLELVEARGGLQTELSVQGERRLPIETEEELYHIAQESLNNALKHARAKRVKVHLWMSERSVHLEVEDDGQGFDPRLTAKSGMGISTMRERAQRIGGDLMIDTTPGGGTKVSVEIRDLRPNE
jgi:signal transduction histidine kinase